MKTNVKSIAENYTEFHKSIIVPFNKTSMTIPPILYYAIATKFADPNEYFKQLTNNTKNEILQNGIPCFVIINSSGIKIHELEYW